MRVAMEKLEAKNKGLQEKCKDAEVCMDMHVFVWVFLSCSSVSACGEVHGPDEPLVANFAQRVRIQQALCPS